MPTLERIFYDAEHSKFKLWLLNQSLKWIIPFNRPHGLRIIALTHESVTVMLPYRRANLNHLKGIHACALAALAEFSCGLMLAVRFPFKDFRLIMKKLDVDYHYQAKSDVVVKFQLTKAFAEEHILNPLLTNEKVMTDQTVEVYDINSNHICTAVVRWQIKKWQNVKTAL